MGDMARDAQAIAERVRDHMWAADRASQGMGMHVAAIGPGTCTMTMTVREDFFHAAQAMHGALYFMMLDNAAFFAVNSIVWNCCSSRSRRWSPSATRCLPCNKARRQRRRRCCSTSRVSGRSSPPSSGRKGCSDTSTIDARSLLTLA